MHKFKGKYFTLILPILVIAVMCVFYAVYGIFPFGSKTVSWCDMDQQTIPLLMNFKDILDGKSDLFYLASSGGGMNFWGVFLFFLASPFYLAVKFIEKQDMIFFVNILLILKSALCAFTSALYFSVSFKKLQKKYTVLLSLVYTFCGFGLMYYQTLVWLDIMYLFPLLVMSADRLCFKKKCGFFIFMLSSCVAVNYYLSFMVIIYLLISVPLYIEIRCRKKDRKNAYSRFVFSSLSAALITAPVWLCSMIQVSSSARSINNIEKIIYEPFFRSFKDKFCIVITSSLVFAVLLFVIKSPLLKKKRVKYNLILLAFLMIPLLIDPINKMWHGGGYQGFPLRYGYIIIFTLLSVTAEFFENFPQSRISSPVFCIISFVILAVFAFTAVYVTITRRKILSAYFNTLHISSEMFMHLMGLFIFSLSACILFLILQRKKLIGNNIFFLLISGVFIVESFVSMSAYVGFASSENTLFEKTLSLEDKIKTDNLYRIKTEKKYIHVNMLSAAGLNSYAHYTSLTPENYMFAMKKTGYSSYWMEVGSNGGTALTDALLGIKYSIGSVSDFKSYQKQLDTDTAFAAAQNLICAPAGIVLNKNPEDYGTLKFTGRYDIQRQLAELYFGNDDLLQKYDFETVCDGLYEYADGKYSITAENNDNSKCKIIYNLNIKGHQTLYFDLFDNLSNRVTEPVFDSVKVNVNGVCVSKSYPNKKNNGLLELGEFENENAEITITFLKDVSVKSFGVFGIDIDRLESEIQNLKTTEPVSNGNEITAECSAGKNEYLYLAVPWDSGFSAYLNGSKTHLYKVNDCFCAVKLDEGHNTIKLVFCPPGFKISVLFMISGIVSAVFLCRKKCLSNNKAGVISAILCRTASVSVIIIVYIVPVILYTAGLFLSLHSGV